MIDEQELRQLLDDLESDRVERTISTHDTVMQHVERKNRPVNAYLQWVKKIPMPDAACRGCTEADLQIDAR
jgi:hypothetical protein